MHDYLLQFFRYHHLPERLQAVSRPFHDMAQAMGDLFTGSYAEGVA